MAKPQLGLDRVNRARTIATLEHIQQSTVATLQSLNGVQAAEVHPQLGELVMMPRQGLQAMTQQLYVLTEFCRDMVEQLQAVEKKTGVLALSLESEDYAGVAIPTGVDTLVLDGEGLYAVVQVPSTVMPGMTVPGRALIARAGVRGPNDTVYTLTQLKAAKEDFDARHAH